MQGRYDTRGHIFLDRDNGETLTLTLDECLEIFSTVTDVEPMPFDRDKVYFQMLETFEKAGML